MTPPYNMPSDKVAFDHHVQNMRSALIGQLSKKDQALIDHLPTPEGQIYRRMHAASPVLWVAPHGFFGDALFSDYIAIFAAEMMAGSCLVNNKLCRCPLPAPGFGDIANLYDPLDPSPHTKAFMKKLMSAISIIRLKSGQTPLIVFLVRLDDNNDTSMEVTVAIGNEKHDCLSSQWSADLKEAVTSSQYPTTFFETKSPSPDDRTLFSHIFHKQPETGPVRLVQLRIADRIVSAETIVDISSFLSRVFSYITQIENKPVLQVDPNEITSAEAEPDMHLVEEAGLKLTEIISRHYENAMLEAGNYLVQCFFGNDIERARNKKATKEKSLYQLILHLQSQKHNAPSKSWVYNAVNLAVDYSDFKNNPWYGKLLLSHKIQLLPVVNLSIKKQLMKETIENKLTISQLKERIGEVRHKAAEKNLPPSPRKNSSQKQEQLIPPPQILKKTEKKGEILSKKLLDAIDDPENLLKQEILQHFNPSALTTIPTGKCRQIFRRLEKAHGNILNVIKLLKADIQKNESYLQQYQRLMVEVEKSIHEKE